jgi:hypothetical protein
MPHDLIAPVLFDKQQLLIIQVHSTSCLFRSASSRYSPQHPILVHPQSVICFRNSICPSDSKNNSTAKLLNFPFRVSSYLSLYLLKH